MKITVRKERKAVAPVIATLLMIAVAVAMSVIIFMWSQGFLSQTSSATGGQQGSQNQAAQSSISIETGTFDTTAFKATIIVRNVGAVTVQPGSVAVSGISSNSGFKGSWLFTFTPATAIACVTTTIDLSGAQNFCNLSKGGAITLLTAALTSGGNLASGDVVNVKVTTNVGTFASSQFTVP